ncbi:MAG: glycosyltransferase family 4 protein [Anaerolineae bacterium]|nr:glycosyltransferase family 4 protein [Anaerolineae bacterium]
MHVLMISLDSAILTQHIGNSRTRHEFYAEQVGRLSMVICNRRARGTLQPYQSERVTAQPINARTYLHYVLDGYRCALRLIAQFPDQPIDLITTQEPFLTALIGLLLKRRLNVPLIIQDHSSFLESEQFAAERWRNRLLRWLAIQTLPRADAVRVVNWQEKAGCVRLGLPSERVCVIPLVPTLHPFATRNVDDQIQTWRQRIDATAETPIILWVGRPVAFKNLPMLIRAFARVRDRCPAAKLVLAGDMTGTDIPAQIVAADLGASVYLPGAVTHDKLPALYQTATLYALSSNYEGLPGVLLEASAASLPIVSTANNGSRDLLTDSETGILTPIGDETAMADAILALINDPERRRKLGNSAREHVFYAFDETRLLTRWVDMWRDVAAGRASSDS